MVMLPFPSEGPESNANFIVPLSAQFQTGVAAVPQGKKKEDEAPSVGTSTVPMSASNLNSAPIPQENNRARLYEEIKGVMEKSPSLTRFREDAERIGLSLDEFAKYLAGFGTDPFKVYISAGQFRTPEARHEIMAKFMGEGSEAGHFAVLMAALKNEFPDLFPLRAAGEPPFLEAVYKTSDFNEGGSGLTVDPNDPTKSRGYFDLRRSMTGEEIEGTIANSDALRERLGIKGEIAPPQVYNVEGEFAGYVNDIVVQLGVLSKFSNYDDMNIVKNAIETMRYRMSRIQDIYTDSPGKEADLRKQLSNALSPFEGNLPEIYSGAIHQEDFAGGRLYTLDVGALETARNRLSDTVLALNNMDSLLVTKVLQAEPSTSDLSGLKDAYSVLSSPSLRLYLNHVLTERYGAQGEGLAALSEMLAVSDGRANSAVDKYLNVLRQLAGGSGGIARRRAREAWITFDATFLSSSALDADGNAPTTSDLAAEMASSLTSYNYLEGSGGSVSTGRRQTWDFYSQLMAAQTLSQVAYMGQSELLVAVLATKSMPAGTQYLYFGDKQFFDAAWRLKSSASSQTSVDAQMPLDSQDSHARNIRMQIYNMAALYMSDLYASLPHALRYGRMSDLMGSFTSLASSGNILTHLKEENVFGTESGHIGLKTAWGFRMPYLPEDFNSTLPFIDASFSQLSLFENRYEPYVNPYMAPYKTNLEYLFGYNEFLERRYHQLMPQSMIMQVYAYDNYLGLSSDYANVMGHMQQAFNDQLESADLGFGAREHGGMLAAQGTEKGYRGAAQYRRVGQAPGQYLSADAFGRKESKKGSTYSPGASGAPGLYSEFDTSTQTQYVGQLHASMIDMGSRIWQGMGRFNSTSTEQMLDENGSPVEGYGFRVHKLERDMDLYLNSTFPGMKRGNMIVNFYERHRGMLPEKVPTGGRKQEFELYDLDILVRLDQGWGRVILSKDQFQHLLTDTEGKDMQPLQDVVKHYFAEYYQHYGANVRTDTAVEVDQRIYGISKLRGNDRVGFMAILQPGINAAGGVVSTTTGDKAVFAGGGSSAHIISGGFYSFNDEKASGIPKVGYGGAMPNYGQYYIPGFRRNVTLPEITENRTYVGSATWLAIDQYRANAFGGWKVKDAQNAGHVAGGQLQTKTTTTSLFMSFDKSNYLQEGLASAGGHIGRVAYSSYAYRPNAAYGSGSAGVAVTIKTKEARNPKDASYLTLSARVREDAWKNQLPTEKTLTALQARIESLDSSITGSRASDMLDVNVRNSLYTNWLQQGKAIATDMVSNLPWYDLSYNWLASGSAGYQSPGFNGKFTYALTTEGNFFYSALSFKERFAVMGGYLAPTPKEGRDPYEWFFNPKWKVAEGVTFGAIVSQTRDRKLISTVQASVEDAFGTSVSFGKEYWRVNLKVGPENFNGVVNFAELPKFNTAEAGLNVRFASAFYASAAFRNISIHNRPGDAGTNFAEIQDAVRLGFMPESVNIQQGALGLTFIGDKSTIDVTGTMTNIGYKGTPHDFFLQASMSFRP